MMVSRNAIEQMAEMALEILGPNQPERDILELAEYTLHKWEKTGNDEDYLLVLFADELRDYQRRTIINEIGRIRLERNASIGSSST